MYRKIHVPVDNSDHSNQAISLAVELGRRFESALTGSHVYAARMHDYRFKQMEYTLPAEYLEENELERQRQIHDSLIAMGLQLISDSYLEPMKRACAEAGLDFTPKMMDGKHHLEIVKDMRESGYDLTVIGALGLGRVRDSQIGSVCERVAREAPGDLWVVKRLPGAPCRGADTILVGIDGSPQSFGALLTAIDLARRFDKRVETISVYDPYLHYSVFNSVVGVLTEKAAKVFRFEEQNQLHEEIIDCGLAQIYQSHLDVARHIAREHETEIESTLLDGKAFQKVLDHVRKIDPWLLVIGRIGVHSDKAYPGLGSNAENLLRACPVDVLLTTRLEYPELDLKAEESIRWTPEAEERMERVPPMVRGIARTAIYRLAVEQGHSVISSDVLDEAMTRFMPQATADQTARLAQALAFDRASREPTSICRKCGITAAEPDPVKCSVCGGVVFELVTPEMLERLAAAEGGLSDETAYDGRRVLWTQEAKRALWTLADAYKRRRAKARVEKAARVRRQSTITLEFAQAIIEEESGVRVEAPAAGAEPVLEARDERHLVARDASKNPLISTYEWTAEAVGRLFQVPSGYMRDKSQERTEKLAAERALATIEAGLVDEGIEVGRRLMEELLAGYEAELPAGSAGAMASGGAPAADGATKCPFAKLSASWTLVSGYRAPDSAKPDGEAPAKPADEGASGLYLNEVSVMSALEDMRRRAQAAESAAETSGDGPGS